MSSTKQDFLKVMTFMKTRIWPYSIGILGMSIFYASISVIESFMIKYIIDAAVKKDRSLLIIGILIITIAAINIIIFVPIFQYMYNKCAQEAVTDVRNEIFKHRGKLPLGFLEKSHSGVIITRILNDTEIMGSLFCARLRRLIYPFIYGFACAIPMFILDWKISILLVIMNFISLFINTRFSNPIRTTSKKIQEILGTMTENLINVLAGIKVIKLFHIGDIIINRYSKSNDDYTKLSVKRAHLSSMLSSTNYFLSIFNNVGIIVLGAFMVSHNLTTFGTLFAIMNLQRRLNQAFLQVGIYLPQIQDALAGGTRVFEYLDQSIEPETYEMSSDTCDSSYIKMTKVDFNYDKDKAVLKELDLSINRGETIALVGPSGGGKSTVLKLLLGFYPPESGVISISGKTLGERTLKELRDLIGYVPQDAYIFDGTIEENIRYGNKNATMEDIIAAAKASNAHDFIMDQEEGYNTRVGERGAKLSGGQKQRVAIARAILKDSPILLLDEATSALDSESELLVRQALDNLMKNRTTIVVAHRLSTIQHADSIYFIDKGKAVEKGTHEELLSLDGYYKDLYETQFKVAN
jgi:ATP-binding cassette subfamily B protein